MSPTDRGRDVLRAIARLTTLYGYPPTVRELAEELGLSSVNGVAEHLERLTALGLITRRPRVARGLTLTAKARSFL